MRHLSSFLLFSLLSCIPCLAASGDSIRVVTVPAIPVEVERLPTVTPMTKGLPASIVTGRRTDEIDVTTVAANLAINNPRQLFNGVAGINIWEFSGTGLQTNVAARGLSAHRSSEFGVRMNGYDIASDPYGYPEAHFAPPSEALERIQLVRGGGGITFGPQFGGTLNYVLREPSQRPFHLDANATGGTYGLAALYAGADGTIDDLSYRAYVSFRRSDGWRPMSGYDALSGHVMLGWQVSDALRIRAELSGASFVEHMPNGLTEAQYAADPRSAFRPRDWFAAPRIMPAIRMDMRISDDIEWHTHVSGLIGDRNSITLVASTAVADSGSNARRVNLDHFFNTILESRLLIRTSLLDRPFRITTGIRSAYTTTQRSQGRGEDGSDYTTTFTAQKTLDLDLRALNIAGFAETELIVVPDMSIGVGARLEFLRNTGSGSYTKEFGATSATPFLPGAPFTQLDATNNRTFPLFSAMVELRNVGPFTLYGNIAQAYRPAFYAQLFPYDGIPTDSAMRPSVGWTSELGAHGTIGSILHVNGSLFFLRYDDRIGIIRPNDVLYPNGYRTNVGRSDHYGLELALDARAWTSKDGSAALTVFANGTVMKAAYVSGPANGHSVENAPNVIVRGGLSCLLLSDLTIAPSISYVSSTYADAASTEWKADGTVGKIPAYTVMDLTATYRLSGNVKISASVNNLLDERYFTSRATAYPGPGILPADGRTMSVSINTSF